MSGSNYISTGQTCFRQKFKLVFQHTTSFFRTNLSYRGISLPEPITSVSTHSSGNRRTLKDPPCSPLAPAPGGLQGPACTACLPGTGLEGPPRCDVTSAAPRGLLPPFESACRGGGRAVSVSGCGRGAEGAHDREGPGAPGEDALGLTFSTPFCVGSGCCEPSPAPSGVSGGKMRLLSC